MAVGGWIGMRRRAGVGRDGGEGTGGWEESVVADEEREVAAVHRIGFNLGIEDDHGGELKP